MSVRSLIRQLLPPVLMEKVSQYRRGWRHIWEGVYETLDDVPAEGPGFSGDAWSRDTRELTAGLLEKFRSGDLCSDKDNSFLPSLVATMGGGDDEVRILDFGGGMGIGYIYCRNALADSGSISYHVVESEKVCVTGRSLFPDDPRITFASQLPPPESRFDIIYLNSVLQYIKEYREVLHALASYRPRYILCVRLSAGDIPTYATSQVNMPGSKVPYWFHNLQELHGIMAECGYLPVFTDRSEREYDQGNFPERYRMGRTSTVLYARNTPPSPPRPSP